MWGSARESEGGQSGSILVVGAGRDARCSASTASIDPPLPTMLFKAQRAANKLRGSGVRPNIPYSCHSWTLATMPFNALGAANNLRCSGLRPNISYSCHSWTRSPIRVICAICGLTPLPCYTPHVVLQPRGDIMPLSMEEVEHIADLARLAPTGEEKERLREELSEILDIAQRLQRID